MKLHVDGRLYVPLGNDPEVLDDWPLHRAKQVHSTRLYVGACWQGNYRLYTAHTPQKDVEKHEGAKTYVHAKNAKYKVHKSANMYGL